MALAVSFCTARANAALGVEDSAADLRDQLELILKATQDRDSKRFESLVSDLQVPDDSNWFVSTFGEDPDGKLAATYKNSWEEYADHLTRAFRDFKAEKKAHLEIEVLSASGKDAMVRRVIEDAKVPLQLYSASISTKNRGKAALPGIYVYVQGSFRVINWYTLYGLPNVRPMRIRIGGNVAAARLIHKVMPEYPTDAKAKQIQGTVVLHAVIGYKGNVEQLEFVSGPPTSGATNPLF